MTRLAVKATNKDLEEAVGHLEQARMNLLKVQKEARARREFGMVGSLDYFASQIQQILNANGQPSAGLVSLVNR